METLMKSMENWRKQWKIEENNGKIEADHGETNENDGKLDKNNWKTFETNRKIDEQCEWEILATKCSIWEILVAKTKEGSLDDPQKKTKNKSYPFVTSHFWL